MAKYFVLLLFFSLAILSQQACMTEDACPAGFVRNNTGDCVDPANLDTGGDIDKERIDPCPTGWQLNAGGFCVKIDADPDGDIGDTDASGDEDLDDEQAGDDAPIEDGDEETQLRPCEADGDCLVGEVCHQELWLGVCLPACRRTSECEGREAGYFCNAEKRCVPNVTEAGCTEHAHCEIGTLCHTEIPIEAESERGTCHAPCNMEGECDQWFGIEYRCTAEQLCAREPAEEGCDEDNDCSLGEVCHEALLDSTGYCMAPCTAHWQCTGISEGFYCNGLQRCTPDHPGEGCEGDAHCNYPDVCHYDARGGEGLCAAYCSENAFCEALGENLFCNARARCANWAPQDECETTDTCPIGMICHPEADEDGVCASACTSHEDCQFLNPDVTLGCNADYECSPDVPVGELETETDGDIDLDPDPDPTDTDPDDAPLCELYTTGMTYTLDVPTAKVQFIAKKSDGQPYVDPLGLSSIYLRDTETGNQFSAIVNFSDGNDLPEIEVIHGTYRVIAKNRLEQRATVIDEITIDEDMTIETIFPVVTMTLHLRRNGEPFPTMPPETQGEFVLYDRNYRRYHIMNPTGSGQNDFTFNIFPGSFDFIFDGYLDPTKESYQIDTMMANTTIDEDIELTFDLATVRIEGEIRVDGQRPPDVEEGEPRGQLWLINVTKGDRFLFKDFAEEGQVRFDRSVVADTYTIGYCPPGLNGHDYLYRVGDYQEFFNNAHGMLINVPQVRFQGDVRWKGEALYELYDPDFEEYIDRGAIYLVDEETNEQFKLVDLGKTGEASFDKFIGKGTYTYRFKGQLIPDQYFVDRHYPQSEHDFAFSVGNVITTDTETTINLPIEEIYGDIMKNGEPFTLDEPAVGEYISVRRENTYEDIPIIHFAKTLDGSYTALLFPHNYDMRFSGDCMVDRYQNFLLYDSFSVSESNLNFDVNLSTKMVRIPVTANNSAASLEEMVNEGLFTSASIIAIDNGVRARATGADWENYQQNGQFILERPVGNHTFILRLVKGEHYMEKPIAKDIDITDHIDIPAELELVTLHFELLKNGLAMPASNNDYSRGDIILRDKSDYLVTVSFDLGQAEAEDMSLPIFKGYYDANFSVGFSDVFQFSQWKYLGCVELDGE